VLHKSKPYQTSLLLCGCTCGIMSGGIAAEIFTVGLGTFILVADKNFAAFILVILIGQLYGVVPAILIGALFGALTGILFKFIPAGLSRLKQVLIGVGFNLLTWIGLWIGLLISLIAWLRPQYLPPDFAVTVFVWMSPFFIFYLAAAVWSSLELGTCKDILDGVNCAKPSPEGPAAGQ
jgi:hypothetical protein